MPRVVNVGLAALLLESGDHIRALYSGAEEREAMLTPYVHAGLAAGDKCVCIVEVADQPALLAGVAGPGDVDVDDCISTGNSSSGTRSTRLAQPRASFSREWRLARRFTSGMAPSLQIGQSVPRVRLSGATW
jgi:hypothetical protein